MPNIPRQLHLYHFINLWDKLYGKKHRWISISFDDSLCYVRIHYAQQENVNLRIWIDKVSNNDPFAKPEYKWKLWKDSIYINDFIMKDKDKQKHFFETRRKLYDCLADFHFGYFDILLDDNKLLRRLYQSVRKQILKSMSWYEEAEKELRKGESYWYQDALKNQPFRFQLEEWLFRKMEERQMAPFTCKKPSE